MALPSYLRLPTKAPALVVPEQDKREREQREEGSLSHPSTELLQGMTLEEFRRSGMVVVVRCPVLGEEVVWAADGTKTSRRGFDDLGRVVYRGEELKLLTLLGAEDQVAYHALRKGAGAVEVVNIQATPPDQAEEPEPMTRKQRGAA